MDSQDSSVNHHTHHPHPTHHHPQPPPMPSHHTVLMGGPHTQHQQQHHPHHPPFNMPYPLPNPNNSMSVPTATSNAAMMHQQQQRPQFLFNPAAPVQKQMDQQYSDGSPSGSGGGGLFGTEQAAARKKRGRPRKYSPDNSIGLGLSPAPVSQISPAGGGGGHLDSGGGTASADTPAKRNRGRPPGSVKKQMDALGVPGVGFTPHVITVDPGEDIASKIVAFSQQGPRTVCILSANGAVSNVTLRQPVSGGTLAYEGRFEIISLSGSFLMSESNGSHGRTGSLSVSLAGPDGRVLGGGVAGVLKAASPVQVVVGSFIAEGKKPKTGGLSSTHPQSTNLLTFSSPLAQPSPSSQGASSDSAEDNDGTSPPDHRGGPSGPYGNAGRPVQNMQQMYATNMGWSNSMKIQHPN